MICVRTVLLCAVSVLCSAGCKSSRAPSAPHTAPAPALKPAPATPLAEQKQDLGSSKTWDPAWDAIVEKALPPEMLSPIAARAVTGFCPNFARSAEADKRAFWAYLFQALAGAEAGLDQTVVVHHTEAAVNHLDKATHAPIKQQGLLQLAYQDAGLYGCNFDWPQDRHLPEKDPGRTILQPANNLGCGIKIIQNQIIRKHRPLVSSTSYWSTLQPGTKSYRFFARQMANVPAVCGTGALKPGPKSPSTKP